MEMSAVELSNDGLCFGGVKFCSIEYILVEHVNKTYKLYGDSICMGYDAVSLTCMVLHRDDL